MSAQDNKNDKKDADKDGSPEAGAWHGARMDFSRSMSYGDNLPDDWGCYYTHCDLCGARYHMSEGGCTCMDDADDCACGKREWTRDRDGTIIWKGSIQSLRRFKDDVREVREGFECGIGLSDFQDLKPGDVIETYEEREVARV